MALNKLRKRCFLTVLTAKTRVKTLPSVSSTVNMGTETFIVFAALCLTARDPKGSTGRDFDIISQCYRTSKFKKKICKR